MYNKLFTKILDSSIWLESDATRLVWLTLLAAMDEDGFAQFASVANLAHRARVTLDACTEAVRCLEAPDANSGDPDHGGRRLERVDGGWVVLNAGKYRLMVTRVVAREQTRERVRKFRAKAAGNAPVTVANDLVTPSEAVTEAVTETKKNAPKNVAPRPLTARRNLHAEFEHPRFDVPTSWHLRHVKDLSDGEAGMLNFYAWLAARVDRTNEDTIAPGVEHGRFVWLDRCFTEWSASRRTASPSDALVEATKRRQAELEAKHDPRFDGLTLREKFALAKELREAEAS